MQVSDLHLNKMLRIALAKIRRYPHETFRRSNPWSSFGLFGDGAIPTPFSRRRYGRVRRRSGDGYTSRVTPDSASAPSIASPK